MSDATVTVKFLKDWKGSVAVDAAGTLGDLVAALSTAAALSKGDVVSMIVKGKRCDPERDGASSLESLGIADGSAIMLVLRSPEQRAAVAAAERRMAKLREVERAAEALAARVGLGAVDGGGYDLTITNQAGQVIELPEPERKGFALGALLHAKGKELLDRCSWSVLGGGSGEQAGGASEQAGGGSTDGTAALAAAIDDATQLLDAAESAFELVSPAVVALGDNVPLCLLDCVWAQLLGHVHAQASAAAAAVEGGGGGEGGGATAGGATVGGVGLGAADGQRAASARLERAKTLLRALHGEGLQRLAEKADSGQQRAVYVRVHLLQGALALVRGEVGDAQSLLLKAKALCSELTIGPEDGEKVQALLGLGVDEASARSALLACHKDVERAAAYALEKAAAERALVERRRAERAMLQYGRTAGGALVDGTALEQVAGMGYPKPLAAEALRRGSNSIDAALSMLSEPSSHQELQLALIAKAAKRQKAPAAAPAAGTASAATGGGGGSGGAGAAAGSAADPAKVVALCEMGFGADEAAAALRSAANDLAAAALALSTGAAGGGATDAPMAEAAKAEEADAAAAAKEAAAKEEEERTIESAELRAAVAATQRAYEGAGLELEAAALRLLMREARLT